MKLDEQYQVTRLARRAAGLASAWQEGRLGEARLTVSDNGARHTEASEGGPG